MRRVEKLPDEQREIDDALSRAATPTHQRTEDSGLDVEHSRTRPVSPNHNPVVSGLSPEDEKLPATEEFDVVSGLGEFGVVFHTLGEYSIQHEDSDEVGKER